MIEYAVVVIAVAFVVLVGYVVPAVVQVRKTVLQAERLLSQLNAELPKLLKELKQTSENVRIISTQAREGVERSSVLMHAIGDVGQTVNRVHDVVRGRVATLLMSLGRLLTGMRAVVGTLKDHAHKEGGHSHGRE